MPRTRKSKPTIPEADVPKAVHTFTVPNWRPATVNELLGLHWAAAGRRKKGDRLLLDFYAQSAGITQAAGRRRVSLVIQGPWRGRTLDPDGCWKSLLDALVHAGLLLDDTQKACEMGTVEFVRGETFETTIKLEDIDC